MIWIIFTIIAWASWPICSKLALNSLHPFAVQFISSLISLPLIFIYCNTIPKDMKWNTSGVVYAVLASLFAVGGSVSYMFAVSKKDVSFVTSLTSAYPALTFVLAILILGESITINKFIGLFCVLLGVFFLSK